MSSAALEMEPKADWLCTNQMASLDEKMSEQAPVKVELSGAQLWLYTWV